MTQREKDGFRPIPKPDALKNLVLKNTGRPFDDDAALLHLREIDGELVKADAKLVDILLKQV